MKRFLRTVAGKCLLFLLTLGLIGLLLLSALGVVAMAEMDFYTRSEQAICRDAFESQVWRQGAVINFLERSLIESDVRSRVGGWHFQELCDKPYVEDNAEQTLRLCVVNDRDRVVGYTLERPDSSDRWYFEIPVRARLDPVYGNIDMGYDYVMPEDPSWTDDNTRIFTVQVSVKETLPNRDIYWLTWQAVYLGFRLRYWIFLIMGLSLILGILSFVALMSVSARRPDTEELRPGPLHRVPFDLMLCVTAAVGILPMIWLEQDFNNGGILFWGMLAVFLAVDLAMVLGLCMGAAGRIKARTLIRDSVIGRVWKLALRLGRWLLEKLRALGRGLLTLLRGIPLVGRTLAVFVLLSLLELFVLFLCGTDRLEIPWLLEKLLLLPAILWFGLCLRKLQAGGRAMARGDLDHKIDTSRMYWDLKAHGEDLNAIAQGMTLAVEERLKSERMKTELITNVSHDLKTPLTSIVNYARLIGEEPCENERITEFAGVLVRQSERLRRLIDDLVEASKAATGNLEVHPVPCDAAMFLSQAGGEFEEKLTAAGLTLVTRCPEEPIRILADSRRMWRIFDNLMNNICKYSMPGTRVYLSLEKLADHAVITFRNTSREPLDLSEEELMERFVRGDSSRNTEGNGLGLSIARSLAELQGGALRITTDGDLFKAILTFPVM